MNKDILQPEVQSFINKELNSDPAKLLFKKQRFETISQQELTEQIVSKKKCQKKLPTWFNTPHIYYPPKINIEQTSSELTASYKSFLVQGKHLVDITGGLGIDCFYFAKCITEVTHCELNKNLSTIVSHNYKTLGVKNIKTHIGDGVTYIKQSTQPFDWIYLDPSRRSDAKGKVFLLEDCLPNVPEIIDDLLEKSNNILIKTSPILDISNGINAMKHVKEVHIVAVDNEVKELLFLIKKEYTGVITIKTINLNKTKSAVFSFHRSNKISAIITPPNTYLFEPNAAILKSGGFNTIASLLKLGKLHPHSHLYTSDTAIDFPGRSFRIMEQLPYQKKSLKKRFSKKQYNITTRNFPITVAELRKTLGIKDGGTLYMFFTTDHKNDKIVLICAKIDQ